MTAELVRGQNHTLPQTRLEIRVSAGAPVVAGATLGDERGTVHGVEWIAHPGSPQLPGLEVSRQAAAEHRLAVDLGALPDAVHRVTVLLALPLEAGGPTRFGAVASPFVAVTGLDGTEIATFTLTGLDSESAVAALELYRRQGAWKVRAVGQGYAGGLAAMLADQGWTGRPNWRGRSRKRLPAVWPARWPRPAPHLGGRPGQARRGSGAGPGRRTAPSRPAARPPGRALSAAGHPGCSRHPSAGGPIDYAHPRRQATAPPPPPPAAPPAQPGQPATPVAGDATGWSMDERLYNQVWGMFEDLARATAAYRSAVDFAESRMDQELERTLSDPRSRIGGAGDRAREQARAKRDELTGRAREALDRDLAQLAAEAAVVEPALPAAYAGWDNPVWHAYRVPMEIPMALRIGDLHLPESAGVRIPLLVRLPLERGMWIDSGRTASEAAALADSDQLRRLAMESAVLHAARMLAVYPPNEFSVHVIDPAGSAAAALAPLVGAGVLASPPAYGPGECPRSSPASPGASTWCRWRSGPEPPIRCRPTSTRPSSC